MTKLDTGTELPDNFILTEEFEQIYKLINNTNTNLFITGKAGSGKSTLLEYFRQNTNKNYAILAFQGITAIKAKGQTIHSFFKFPPHFITKENVKELKDKKVIQNLDTILIDEISMVGDFSFYDLHVRLQEIMTNNDAFGGICILTVGDFLQLPPVKQDPVFSDRKPGSYGALALHLWKDFFKLHELTVIVRQVEDPQFAELLSRIRTGDHTTEDVVFIKSLEHTSTDNWPEKHVRLFLTNRLTDQFNQEVLSSLPSEKIVISAKDSVKDSTTKRCSVVVPDDMPISSTAGLPAKLTVCVGARILLTANLDISDHLVNGSTGTVVFLHFSKHHSPLNGEIYVKFDEPNAGNKLKSNKIPALKECVAIKAETKPFHISKKGSNITVTQTQYPFRIAFAMTIHKSQGGTYKYMEANFDRSSINPKRLTPINPGQGYTALSRGKMSNGIKLVNFHEDNIKVNTKALLEMNRLKPESLLDVTHPALYLTGNIIALLNIRSWNLHLQHFVCDPVHLNHCSIFCFTETNLKRKPTCDISDFCEKVMIS